MRLCGTTPAKPQSRIHETLLIFHLAKSRGNVFVLTLVLLLAGMALAVASFHGLIRWSLRAPRMVERETPEKFGLAHEEVWIPGAGGKSLFGWLVPTADESAPTLVILHGWGGNAETMLPLVPPLHRAGFALLLFDARNHGRSDADTFSSLPRFAEDLDYALDWLQVSHGMKPDQRVGIVGHSVGAAAALLAASRRHDLAAVVSIAAFAHPASMMRRLLKSWHVPYLPFGWYVLSFVQRVIGYRFDDIAPLNTLAHVRCPVLLVHGTDDTIVPVAEAELLHARRGRNQGGLLLVKGGHDRYEELDRQIGDVIDFLNAALKSVARL